MGLNNNKTPVALKDAVSQREIARQVTGEGNPDPRAVAAKDVKDVFAKLEHLLASRKTTGN